MNYQFLLSAIFVILVSMIAGCSSKHAKAPEMLGEGVEIRIYEVFGMDCPGCHGGLENLVLKIPAVHSGEANWKEQRLVVSVKPGAVLDDEMVYDAVRRANFTPGKRLQ